MISVLTEQVNYCTAMGNSMCAKNKPAENEIIEYEEFRRYKHVRKICKEPEQRRSILKEAFKVFDRDGDGYITADDVARVLRNMGERVSDEGAKQLIAMADKDGNGRVNFDEYVEVMSSD